MEYILNQIEKTTLRNEKIELASKYFTRLEHEMFEFVFSKINLNIKERTLQAFFNEYNKKIFSDLGEYLDKAKPIQVIEHKFSFNEFINKILEAKGTLKKINTILSLLCYVNEKYHKWYIRALLKNMRVGINLNNYNKIREKQNLPLIESFYVKLANSISEQELENLKYPILVEQKFDGIRCIVDYNRKRLNKVILFSRSGNDITEQLPEIVKDIKVFCYNNGIQRIILDGEIISKDFNTLQKRLGRLKENLNEDESLTYIIFDIAKYNNVDYKSHTLSYRKKVLENFKFINTKSIYFSLHKIANNKDEILDIFNDVLSFDGEGVMIKELESLYTNDRNAWYKLKPILETDVKIADVKYGSGKNHNKISSLICEDEKGIKVSVGSGLTDNDIEIINKLYKENKLINTFIEIEYQEKTKNSYRFPRFKRFRFDKNGF